MTSHGENIKDSISSATMVRKQRKAAQTDEKSLGRDTVLRAAATVFMNQSFADASVDDVAALLGATKGRIYHYYESKLDIYLDIHRVAMTALLAGVEPVSKLELPTLDRLRQMAHRHLVVTMTGFPFQKVSVQGFSPRNFYDITTEQRRSIRKIVDMRDSYEDLYAFEIERGVEEGVIWRAPPRLLTKPFLGALNWLTVWYDPSRSLGEVHVQQIATTLSHFVVNGLTSGSGEMTASGGVCA